MADARRTLESSAAFTRGGGPPAPDHDADHAARQARVEIEQGRLIEWAREKRKLRHGHRVPPEFARGGEHVVYFHRNSQRYIKATLPNRQKGYGIALGSYSHGATPAEYLDRLILHNTLFDDDIRLEKVLLNGGRPIVVTSQPAIKGHPAKPQDLDVLMQEKGYEKLADGAFYDEREGLLVFDLFPRNAIQTEDRRIYPIDPVIQRIDHAFGQFLRDHPHTINNR